MYRFWTQPSGTPGRPSTSGSLRRLILETANDNPTWGYRRITGELAGLDYRVGEAGKQRVSPTGHRPRTLRPVGAGMLAPISTSQSVEPGRRAYAVSRS